MRGRIEFRNLRSESRMEHTLHVITCRGAVWFSERQLLAGCQDPNVESGASLARCRANSRGSPSRGAVAAARPIGSNVPQWIGMAIARPQHAGGARRVERDPCGRGRASAPIRRRVAARRRDAVESSRHAGEQLGVSGEVDRAPTTCEEAERLRPRAPARRPSWRASTAATASAPTLVSLARGELGHARKCRRRSHAPAPHRHESAEYRDRGAAARRGRDGRDARVRSAPRRVSAVAPSSTGGT